MLKEEVAELCRELKDELAGVRQEIAALVKTVEANHQTMLLRFKRVDWRFGQIDQRFGQIDQRFGQIDQQFSQHASCLTRLENWMRATFVMLMIVVVGVTAQLFYMLLRFGLKPSL